MECKAFDLSHPMLCISGLHDPNFGRLLRWADETLKDANFRQYVLMRDEEARNIIESGAVSIILIITLLIIIIIIITIIAHEPSPYTHDAQAQAG